MYYCDHCCGWYCYNCSVKHSNYFIDDIIEGFDINNVDERKHGISFCGRCSKQYNKFIDYY